MLAVFPKQQLLGQQFIDLYAGPCGVCAQIQVVQFAGFGLAMQGVQGVVPCQQLVFFTQAGGQGVDKTGCWQFFHPAVPVALFQLPGAGVHRFQHGIGCRSIFSDVFRHFCIETGWHHFHGGVHHFKGAIALTNLPADLYSGAVA